MSGCGLSEPGAAAAVGAPGAPDAPDAPRSVLCAVVKNEADDIAEWVAHHLAVGFSAVFLYDDESDDGTAEVLARLAEKWPVAVIACRGGPGEDIQMPSYAHAVTHLRGHADWVAFFDTDEFLIPVGGERVPDLLRRLAASPHIVVNWLMFGSGGHDSVPPSSVLRSFTRRAPVGFGPNAHVKSIVRPETVREVINPHMFDCGGPCVDVRGAAVTDWQLPGVRRAGEVVTAPWRLHHYFTRSRAHWARRLTRGQAHRAERRSWADFADYDRNEEEDATALPWAEMAAWMLRDFG